MSDFRKGQDQSHPSRTNALMTAIICVLVVVVAMQIWLLTAALNTELAGDHSVKWPAFWASLALFLSGAALLRYLPSARGRVAAVAPTFDDDADVPLRRRTLAISAVSLALSFAVWFMWSAIPLRLNDAGFDLSRQQLFWLASTPVILGSLLRIPYGVSVSIYGSRRAYAAVTLWLVVPCLATALAVSNPATPYWVLLCCAALTGTAGANFATSMAVINLWFPKRLQGTALGINGLGNLGVTLAQLIIPIVIAWSPVLPPAAPSAAKSAALANAALVWIVPALLCTAAIWLGTEDKVVERKSVLAQLGAGRHLHTWVLSTLYFLTFGCFVAMGASLPLVIKEVFASAPGGAPTPLLFAPWAAAAATVMRPVGGWLADRFGGGRITAWSIAVMAIGGFSLSAFLRPTDFAGFFTTIVIVCAAAGLGNGSVFKMIPSVLPKQAAAVIGVVSCMGAFGGFLPPLILGWTLDSFGSPALAYTAMSIFALGCFGLNAWYYVRESSPTHC